MSLLFNYFKFPDNFLEIDVDRLIDVPEKGYFLFKDRNVCFGSIYIPNFSKTNLDIEQHTLNNYNYHLRTEGNKIYLPFDIDEIISNLLFEKYLNNSITNSLKDFPKTFLRTTYYTIRPILPISIRKHLQKFSLRKWNKIIFPHFPNDFTVQNIYEDLLKDILQSTSKSIPFIWFWPDEKDAAAIMTHDVETEEGRAFCTNLMDMEDEYNIKSSFQVVPEVRYYVTKDYLNEIKNRGFEVGIHGLNHDGKLYNSKKIFLDRVKKINDYARKWDVVGFRSPVMYRNLDWYNNFKFEYDMSVPNNANIDPQKGGCCSVFPYFIGDILEIPLTTIQDHPLYYYFNDYTINMWELQAEEILKRNGLISFVIHPDYTISQKSQQNYRRLLGLMAKLRDEQNVWTALPRDINEWWRIRHNLKLEMENGDWVIKGKGCERASLAYISLVNGEIKFTRKPAEPQKFKLDKAIA